MRNATVLLGFYSMVLTIISVNAQSHEDEAPLDGAFYHERPEPQGSAAKVARVEPRHWKELVGEKVVVEGVAWLSEKSSSVLLYRAQIYIQTNESVVTTGKDGKLVKVTGKLGIRHSKPAAPGAAGRSVARTYFVIEDPKIEEIRQVKWPYLRVLQQ